MATVPHVHIRQTHAQLSHAINVVYIVVGDLADKPSYPMPAHGAPEYSHRWELFEFMLFYRTIA
eukprot:1485451-Pyramimonas_sp.AAC.1